VAGLVLACAKPSPPSLQPERVTLTGLDLQGMAVTVEVSATNPNAIDLDATALTSHLVVDKTHDVGAITLPESITLPAGKTTKLSIPIAIKWTEVGFLAQLGASGGAVPYSVDGTLELGGKLLHVGVPFHLDGAITHEQLLGAALGALPKITF
jgi:hypothetical protein